MEYLIRFSVLITALALISCNGSGNDTDNEDAGGDNSSGSSYSIAGIKTMAVEYSTYLDMIDGEDSAPVVSGEVPVEENGFITMSASSIGDIIIAGAAHGNLYYSDDGGITWYTIEGIGVQEYWTGATVSADGEHIAVAGQSLYISNDSGDTWTVYPFSYAYDGSIGLAMSDDGATIAKAWERFITELDVSHDYGETWIENDFDGLNNLVDFDLSADGQRVAALHYSEELKISDDGGTTWTDTVTGIVGSVDMDMSPDGQIIALLDTGWKYEHINEDGYVEGQPLFDVYLSLDGGESWTIRTMVEGIQGPQVISITNDGSKILVSGFVPYYPFMLSEDYGATWKEISPPESEKGESFYTHIFSNSGNRIIAMEEEYSIWTSDDMGRTWIKRLQGLGEE